MAQLSDLIDHAGEILRPHEIQDFPNAFNGLQIENDGQIKKIGATVDASARTLQMAAEREVDFLIVHHGLFWPGVQLITGAFRQALLTALKHNIALYSIHLPLDLHPQIGNNALLAAALGITETEPFLNTKGQPLGLKARCSMRRDELLQRLEHSLGGPVRCIGGGPMETNVIGIVTGGAGGEIYAVAGERIDTYITGEAPHWAAVAAEDLGMNLVLGGHYATETFGVKALATQLSAKFDLPWEFLDRPTGL